MKGWRRLALCPVLAAVALFASACHGTTLSAGGVYYLDAQECADGVAAIRLYSPVLSGSNGGGSSGHFYADNNGCHPLGSADGTVLVHSDLIREGAGGGLCVAGPGWASNSGGSYAVGQIWNFPYICADGYYHVTASHRVFITDGYGWSNHATNSPTDYYCNHNPCQG